jgi:hypothetical protein
MITDLAQDLTKYLTDGEEAPCPVRPEDAERSLRILAQVERELREIEEFAATEMAKIQEWADDRAAGPRRVAAETRRALEGYARAVHPDPTRGRVITLPSGVLRLTAPQDSLKVDNEAVAAKFLMDNGLPGAALSVAVKDLKVVTKPGAVFEQDDHLAAPAVTDDGEVIPGVHYERGRRPSFTVHAK